MGEMLMLAGYSSASPSPRASSKLSVELGHIPEGCRLVAVFEGDRIRQSSTFQGLL